MSSVYQKARVVLNTYCVVRHLGCPHNELSDLPLLTPSLFLLQKALSSLWRLSKGETVQDLKKKRGWEALLALPGKKTELELPNNPSLNP